MGCASNSSFMLSWCLCGGMGGFRGGGSVNVVVFKEW